MENTCVCIILKRLVCWYYSVQIFRNRKKTRSSSYYPAVSQLTLKQIIRNNRVNYKFWTVAYIKWPFPVDFYTNFCLSIRRNLKHIFFGMLNFDHKLQHASSSCFLTIPKKISPLMIIKTFLISSIDATWCNIHRLIYPNNSLNKRFQSYYYIYRNIQSETKLNLIKKIIYNKV
ncbi:hypothetical protein BpHYR1_039064 [Brachionus plicatilis]|uniref:Uncharacterized protein n=1 Tax=Brachionus plicatilis TaxID=10195 RepID=A0A3M7RCB7_BRAPC|nr:hypothetical protein BpHYR1_039064 [Brachionus plicatilis]